LGEDCWGDSRGKIGGSQELLRNRGGRTRRRRRGQSGGCRELAYRTRHLHKMGAARSGTGVVEKGTGARKGGGKSGTSLIQNIIL